MEIASEKFNNKFSLKTIVLVLIISGIALSFEYPKIDSNGKTLTPKYKNC